MLHRSVGMVLRRPPPLRVSQLYGRGCPLSRQGVCQQGRGQLFVPVPPPRLAVLGRFRALPPTTKSQACFQEMGMNVFYGLPPHSLLLFGVKGSCLSSSLSSLLSLSLLLRAARASPVPRLRLWGWCGVTAGTGTPVSPRVAGPVCRCPGLVVLRVRCVPLTRRTVLPPTIVVVGRGGASLEPGGATRSALRYHAKTEVHRQLAYWALLFFYL